MELILDIPKDRKPLGVVRICLMIGLTVLVYLLVASPFGIPATHMLSARAG